jgi:16S rRNA (guanine1207-N2)-methyltransferase
LNGAVSGEHYFSAVPASAERPRRIGVTLDGAEFEFEAAGGVFSADGIDPGTGVLLDTVPPPPESGAVLDLGCGWGPIAIAMARRAPRADVWAVDVNQRALALTAANARIADVQVNCASPDDIPPDLAFATIWSNPPIRVGKEALHDLLARWLPRLEPGGTAWLVVAKQLGADSLARWLEAEGWTVSREGSKRGYRVLAVTSRTASSGNATSPR